MEFNKKNFLYEIDDNKYIIWNIKNNKISNKQYFFWSIDNLDFDDNSKIFLQDTKFNYYQKSFAFYTKNKLTINDIEKEINIIDIWKDIFVGYSISDIKIDWQNSSKILWKKWDIEYTLWIYTLAKIEYNKILKYFWKNSKINIFPNSLFLIKYIWKDIKNGNLLYFWNDKIEILNIKNSFYAGVEVLNIWTKIFLNNIKEIYGYYLTSLSELSSFHKKIYEKELEKYIEPILLFLKENIKQWNIYIIWDFKNLPQLLEKLSTKLKQTIIPVQIEHKKFESVEKANLFCIEKFNI